MTSITTVNMIKINYTVKSDVKYFSHLNIYPYRQQKTLFIEVVYCNEGRIIFSMLLLSLDAFMQTQGFGEIQRSRPVFP